MHKTFAIQPEVAGVLTNLRVLRDQMGVACGRLIAEVPAGWERQVLEIARAGDFRETELMRIVEILGEFRTEKKAFIPRSVTSWKQDDTWLANFLREEQRCGGTLCDGLVTKLDLAGNEKCVPIDDLSEKHPVWQTRTQTKCLRTAADMAKAAATLLRYSTEFLFVDPHFDPETEDQRFIKPLKAFLQAIFHPQRTAKTRVRKLEYHLSGVRKRRRDGSWYLLSKPDFAKVCCRDPVNLEAYIQKGVALKFVRWLPGTEKMHPRYVLTELGGLRFDWGLDEGLRGSTTDVVLLEEAHYREVFDQYDTGRQFTRKDTIPILGKG